MLPICLIDSISWSRLVTEEESRVLFHGQRQERGDLVHLFLDVVEGARPDVAEDEKSRDHPRHLQRYEKGGEDGRFDEQLLFERVLQVLRTVDEEGVPLPDDPFEEGAGVIVASAPADAEGEGGENIQDDDVVRGLFLNSHDHRDIERDILPELVQNGMEKFAVPETGTEGLADAGDGRHLLAVPRGSASSGSGCRK